MASGIPRELDLPVNQRVLEHIQKLSAHSDLADPFRAALKPLGDVQIFCPDWQNYRCIAASTSHVIFAAAIGMSVVLLRLDATMKARALKCGAEPYPQCGPEWVAFELFRSDWPRPDLEFWARKAYAAAREHVASQ